MKIGFKKLSIFFRWVKKYRNNFFFQLFLGLLVLYILYFFQDSYYKYQLNNGKNIYTNTIKVDINNSGYVSQLQYFFIVNGNEFSLMHPEDIDLDDFDYSKTYTVRYLKEDPSYSELILVEWEEYKKQLDPDEYVEYLDK